MDSDIKTQWIARTRDPGVVQDRLLMGRPNGSRCPLGLLCDLAVEAGVIPAPTIDRSLPLARMVWHGESTVLPVKVMLWAGLTQQDPRIRGKGTLTTINDNGTTLPDIGALIQQYL